MHAIRLLTMFALVSGCETEEGYFDDELRRLGPMARDGLIEVAGHRVRVTEAGRPMVRSVCAVFDRYLTNSRARHSRAV